MHYLILLVVMFFGGGWFPVSAQEPTVEVSPKVENQVDLASNGAELASRAAETATPAARLVVERVTRREPDITEPEGEIKGRLEQYLAEQEVAPLGPTNVLQYAIRAAVERGVPANTIVLVLLFPVVAALIAAGRHLVGLRGFGIFVPAILSVAFVATGIVNGIFMFLVILLVATMGRRVLRYLKMQYLPRMSLLLWFVSAGVFVTLILTPFMGFESLTQIQIFPILILILLAENFIEVQISKSAREATKLTIETVILALISSLVLSLDSVQRLALLHPETTVLSVMVFNIFLGKYEGLRLSEYLKFRSIIG